MNIHTVGYKTKSLEPRNLALFLLIAFGWSWLLWSLFIFGILKMPAGIGTSKVDIGSAGPIILLIVLTPYGPTIAAFLITAINEGKSGVIALLKRFWNRSLSFKWLVVILLFSPAMRLVANLLSRLPDGQAYPFLTNPDQPWLFFPPLIANVLVNGGMSEEFGWRGYILPRFQSKWNALTSSIVLGAIWAAWHIPLWFMPGDVHQNTNFWQWAARLILMSILMTWIFNNTNGAVFSAILFHGMANASGDLIWCCGSEWAFNVVYVLVVILVVVIFGPRSLVRGQPEATIEKRCLSEI